MSAMLPTESKSPSRRALLAGALGGLGAWAASAIGRASPVRAEGEAIVVGGEYTTAQSVTKLVNQGTPDTVFHVETAGTGWGLRAIAVGGFGVYGSSQSNMGVFGASNTGYGVYGYSPSVRGVFGSSMTGLGVWGSSETGTGVRGSTGGGVGVHGRSSANIDVGSGDKAGVLGESTLVGGGTASAGVWGRSTNNVGVFGQSQSNNGVSGVASTTGNGVFGGAQSGEGVLGSSGSGRGVRGISASAQGVLGRGPIGVEGVSTDRSLYGVGGYNNIAGGTGVLGAAYGAGSVGVYGETNAGHAIEGQATAGYAGYFSGKVFSTKFYELAEISLPPAAPINRARLFVRDNGAGKTQLCVRFHSGPIRVLATEG